MEWDHVLPLGYRLNILFNLGLVYYYCLISICHHRYGMNIIKILHLQHEYGNINTLLGSTRKFTKSVTVINLASLIVYNLLGKLMGEYLFILQVLPVITLIFNFYIILVSGEGRLMSIFQRVLLGRIDTKSLRINDLLMSDSITSYSKIILDLANYLNYIIYYGSRDDDDDWKKLDQNRFGVDLIILGLPQLIRLSQCWFEWNHSNRRNRQPFLNFIKYSTNVAPLVMIFITRSYTARESSAPGGGGGGDPILMLEKLLILVNSMYTFFWDVMIDWNFTSVKQAKRNDWVFDASIVFDCSLRFLWLWKFIFTSAGFFYYFHDSDPGMTLFVMQFLEVTRRFVWCIHRLNTEAMRDSITSIEMTKV
ncbi:Erd1 protein [Saccharomycopsis crataegensis]|uniref:Erd1 protein n=1 Tax=Saccharomycopsis crataegensis TaxID=43959 RepID=A0AAV5QT91_9ASCO|nr:Erd1 protein [Saccharomycopsis crataegensis]